MNEFIKFVVLRVLVGCLLALSLMFLWNSAIPGLFGLTPLSFAQAIALHFLVCNLVWTAKYTWKLDESEGSQV